MKYQIDHDLHIHTNLSLCSKDEDQTAENIIKYAEENGLKRICVTDHFWDSAIGGASNWYKQQDFEHISKVLPLPEKEGIKFGFGAETELDKNETLGITKETMEKMDFIIIPTTHLHMEMNFDQNLPWVERAGAWFRRLKAVLNMDLPFEKIGIAHLACKLLIPNGKTEDLFYVLDEEGIARLFAKAAKLGVGIEINADDFDYANQSSKRIRSTLKLFKMAKKQGCKFYLGSDAHHTRDFQKALKNFAWAIKKLKLTEEDKFIPKGM